jgi:ribosomal protein L9
METTKLILLVDHRTLGSKGVVFEVPSANVSAWIDSGKAKKHSKGSSKQTESGNNKKSKKKK